MLSKPKNSGGFSIVELIVSIGIGLFIMGGLGSVLLTSRDIFNNEQGSSFIQENARYAVEILKRDLRLAGSGFCTKMDFYGEGGSVGFASSILESDYKGLLDLEINEKNPVNNRIGLESITGFDYSEIGSYPEAFQIEADGSNGDAIIVRYGNPSLIATVSSHVGTKFNVLGNPGFEQEDILLVVDSSCRNAGLFKANTVTSGEINHDNGNCSERLFATNPGDSCKCQGASSSSCLDIGQYSENSSIMPFVSNAYYIAESNLLQNVPALKRRVMSGTSSTGTRVEELAQGVESLELTYGLDTAGDGVVDRIENAATIQSSTDYEWSQVVSVRYEMTIRSLENILIEDGPEGDRYLRQNVSGSVRIRNR